MALLFATLKSFSRNKSLQSHDNLNMHLTRIAAYFKGSDGLYEKAIQFNEPESKADKQVSMEVRLNCLLNFIAISFLEHHDNIKLLQRFAVVIWRRTRQLFMALTNSDIKYLTGSLRMESSVFTALQPSKHDTFYNLLRSQTTGPITYFLVELICASVPCKQYYDILSSPVLKSYQHVTSTQQSIGEAVQFVVAWAQGDPDLKRLASQLGLEGRRHTDWRKKSAITLAMEIQDVKTNLRIEEVPIDLDQRFERSHEIANLHELQSKSANSTSPGSFVKLPLNLEGYDWDADYQKQLRSDVFPTLLVTGGHADGESKARFVQVVPDSKADSSSLPRADQ